MKSFTQIAFCLLSCVASALPMKSGDFDPSDASFDASFDASSNLEPRFSDSDTAPFTYDANAGYAKLGFDSEPDLATPGGLSDKSKHSKTVADTSDFDVSQFLVSNKDEPGTADEELPTPPGFTPARKRALSEDPYDEVAPPLERDAGATFQPYPLRNSAAADLAPGKMINLADLSPYYSSNPAGLLVLQKALSLNIISPEVQQGLRKSPALAEICEYLKRFIPYAEAYPVKTPLFTSLADIEASYARDAAKSQEGGAEPKRSKRKRTPRTHDDFVPFADSE